MPEGTTSGSRALTALVGVVATVLLGWVLIEGATILQPLVIAMLLCNILQPVVRALASAATHAPDSGRSTGRPMVDTW